MGVTTPLKNKKLVVVEYFDDGTFQVVDYREQNLCKDIDKDFLNRRIMYTGEDVLNALLWLRTKIKKSGTKMLSCVDADGSKWIASSKDYPPVFIQEGLILKQISDAFPDIFNKKKTED